MFRDPLALFIGLVPPYGLMPSRRSAQAAVASCERQFG
jgi:hypothetical protein